MQREGVEELETIPSVPQLEEQAEAAEGKVTVDYKQGIDYKSEGWDPDIKPVNHAEEEANANAEYTKIESPCKGTFKQ